MESDEIFLLGCIILEIALILLVWKVYKRIKEIPYIINAIVSGLLLIILYFLASYSRFQTGFPNIFMQNISLIPMDFLILFIYLYFESLYTARIPEKRLLLFGSLFFFNICINILNSFNLFEYKNFFSLFAAFTYFFGSIVAIFGLYVLRQTLKVYNTRPVKIDFFAVFTLLLGFIVFQISGISQYWVDWASLLFWIGNAFMISSAGIILVNSILNGNYIYLVPNPIQFILIYTNGGVLLYNRSFTSQNSEPINKDECMISGGMSGFSTFFKEILGSDATFKYIDAHPFEFIFEQLPKNLGSVVVVTKRANRIILRSMKNLVINIPESYLQQIRANLGMVMMKEFDALIKKYFPFLDLPIVPKTN